MSDELRDLFEESTQGVPVPDTGLGVVKARGRALVRRRAAAVVVSIIAVLGAGAFAVEGFGGDRRPVPPVDHVPPSSPRIDETARRVIDELGPQCHGFDFYYRRAFAGRVVRPVQCDMQFVSVRRDPSPSASPTPSPSASPAPEEYDYFLARGPRVMIYAFPNAATKRAWLNTHQAPWGGRVAGEDWVVDVMRRAAFEDVLSELVGDRVRIAAWPAQTWRLGSHVIEPVADDYVPEWPLRRVSRRHSFDEEILGAQLEAYSDTRISEPVPAWIITLGKCVPQYGGEHASSSCSGDQSYVVIDATSGKRIATFSN